MPVLIRDTAIITPALRDGAPNSGPLDNMVMTGAGAKFTEPIDVGTYVELLGLIDIIAQSGTNPTLDVLMQYGYKKTNGSFAWIDSGDAFTQITTTLGISKKQFTANFGKYIRFRFTLAGTSPVYTVSFKLSVKG